MIRLSGFRRRFKRPQPDIQPLRVHCQEPLGKGFVIPRLQWILGDLHHRQSIELGPDLQPANGKFCHAYTAFQTESCRSVPISI